MQSKKIIEIILRLKITRQKTSLKSKTRLYKENSFLHFLTQKKRKKIV